MRMEFDGLVAAGTFAGVTEIPDGCNIVHAKWLYKWKGDSHGMVDRAKARMVAMGYREFDGLVAAGTFAEVTEIPEGCNIVDAKWLYKWKGEGRFAWCGRQGEGPHGSYGVQPGRGSRLV